MRLWAQHEAAWWGFERALTGAHIARQAHGTATRPTNVAASCLPVRQRAPLYRAPPAACPWIPHYALLQFTMSTFESLPVELIADILGELDIASLVIVSYLSRRLQAIASDSSLNPWRRPILRALCESEDEYEPGLKHLSIRQTVPRQNWVEVLSLAKAEYLLFETTLPNLREAEWEECFRRRFLPGWTKWKTTTWKAAFLK